MKRIDSGKILLGIVIIIIGTLLLLDNLGICMRPIWRIIFKLWPLIFVYIGLRMIIQSGSSSSDEKELPPAKSDEQSQNENPTPTSP